MSPVVINPGAGIEHITAADLNHSDINSLIVFTWRMPRSGIQAVITGILCEISLHPDSVIVEVRAYDNDSGELSVFELLPEDPITLNDLKASQK